MENAPTPSPTVPGKAPSSVQNRDLGARQNQMHTVLIVTLTPLISIWVFGLKF